MFIIELLKAIAQGIIQGITEWLPISSTAHILLLDAVWKMDATQDFFDIFKVVIQIGSILAVVVLYFRTLNPFAPSKSRQEKTETWVLWLKILIASIPAAIVGLALDGFIDAYEHQTIGRIIIAAALIVYGIAFIVMERCRRDGGHTRDAESLRSISYRRAFGIGMFQMLALIPGTSRSGSTILGATLLGTSRPVAAEFSFFMAIPVMLGASGLKAFKAFILDGLRFSAQEWILLAVSTVVAFLVSLVVIRFLIGYIRKHSFEVFGWYRIILGLVVLAVIAFAPQIFS